MSRNLLISTALLLSACATSAQANTLTACLPSSNPQKPPVHANMTASAILRPTGFSYPPPAGVLRRLFVSYIGGTVIPLVANTVTSQATSTTNHPLSVYGYIMNGSAMGRRTNDVFTEGYFPDNTAADESRVPAVFTADNAKHIFPILTCSAFKTGNHNTPNNFLTSSVTRVFQEGDLCLNFSNRGGASALPLTSEIGTQRRINQQTKALNTGIRSADRTRFATFGTIDPPVGNTSFHGSYTLRGYLTATGSHAHLHINDKDSTSEYSQIITWSKSDITGGSTPIYTNPGDSIFTFSGITVASALNY